MDRNMMIKAASLREIVGGMFSTKTSTDAEDFLKLKSEARTLQKVNKNLTEQTNELQNKLKEANSKKLKSFGAGITVGGGGIGTGEYYYNKKYNKPKKETILREMVVGPDGKYKKTIQLNTLGQPTLGNSQPAHMPLAQGINNLLALNHNG